MRIAFSAPGWIWKRSCAAKGCPLYGLESKRPLRDFDLLAISLPYEQLYTNALNMLDLAGMPLLSVERDATYPLVIAGGHACYNPEPMADFIDAFVIGEGEEIILDVCRTLQAMRGQPREEQLRALAQHRGRLCAALLRCGLSRRRHDCAAYTPNTPDVPPVVRKRIVPVLPKPFTRFLVPNVDTVHNRAPIEIMRGCTRGCRFCHAGMVTRPVRERPVEEVVAAAEEIVRNTGFEEIGLLSLSSSDYTHVKELVHAIGAQFGGAEPERQPAQPAHRIGERRSDGRAARYAAQRLHPCARSGHRKDARHHQQVRAGRAGLLAARAKSIRAAG